MKLSRLNWITVVVVIAAFCVAGWYYPQLPDPVPTHWNAAGQVDDWTPKPWGVWLFPLIEVILLAMLLVLPVISPRGFRLEQSRRAYDIVMFVIVAFMLLLQLISYRSAITGGQELAQVVPMSIGLLFIVLGNYMGKFQKNFFIGIRTPWTLASDEVWNRTHRLGGRLFMAGGAVILVSGFWGFQAPLFMAAIVAVAVIPMLYSLLLYRRLEGFDNDE